MWLEEFKQWIKILKKNSSKFTAACLLYEEGDEKLVNKRNLRIISMKWFALKFSKWTTNSAVYNFLTNAWLLSTPFVSSNFLTIPTSTDISIGYPIDVSADPVGYPSWMSYGCLQDILMSSPMDVKRVYP